MQMEMKQESSKSCTQRKSIHWNSSRRSYRLGNFYEIAGSLGDVDTENKQVFMSLFSHSLIGKAEDYYLDQTVAVMDK